jgi:capsular polysaccharide transport system permease protein
MIKRIRQHPLTSVLLGKGAFSIAFIVCLAAALYWGLIASDRYVSEARILIQRTDIGGGQPIDFSSLLGAASSGNRGDQLLLRDHLLSIDMLRKLDAKLGLRTHYASNEHDLLSRLWFSGDTIERFHKYYLSRVDVTYDDYSGVLVVRAQAFDPSTAQAIARVLVEEGERSMNDIAHHLAQEQVSFVEKQTAQLAERFRQARQDVLAYQNKKGLVSPQGTAEALNAAIAQLEANRTELQTKRTAMLGYLDPKAAAIVELDLQLAAIEKQIDKEKGKLASSNGKTLNATVEEYQRLEMAAAFAQDVYKTALVALEKARIEATRTIKKVSVVQQPTLPESADEPRRTYNILLFVLVALVTAGIAHLLTAIARDHKD